MSKYYNIDDITLYLKIYIMGPRVRTKLGANRTVLDPIKAKLSINRPS